MADQFSRDAAQAADGAELRQPLGVDGLPSPAAAPDAGGVSSDRADTTREITDPTERQKFTASRWGQMRVGSIGAMDNASAEERR
jgi:hypothetical protein